MVIAAYHPLQAEFYSRYSTVGDVPPDRMTKLVELQQNNQSVFALAEGLGREP